MDIKAINKNNAALALCAAPDNLRTERRTGLPSRCPRGQVQIMVKEPGIMPRDSSDAIFMHAPVSLWEEDFSEVKRRFDELKRNGVEDLRKHFKKHPDEVLKLARMVRLVRVNNATLALYDAARSHQFRSGLSLIFDKGSFDVFKEEVMAFWNGRTSFTSDAINLTLNDSSKNILIHAIIPPGYEHTWTCVYVAIADITAFRDSARNLEASEQKYRMVFDAVHAAVLLADVPSGIIIEANKSAKKLFGASDGELVGLHLADLLQGEEQDAVRTLQRLHPDRPGLAGKVLRLHFKGNDSIPARVTTETIEIGYAKVIVMSLTPAEEQSLARSAGRKFKASQADMGKKLTNRERQILGLICDGKTNRMIATQLSISNKTVETHRTRIMQKLETHCVAGLVKFAVTNGLAQLH